MIRRSSLTLVAGVTLVVTLATGCAGHRSSVSPAAQNSTSTTTPVSSVAPVSSPAPVGTTATQAAAPVPTSATAPAATTTPAAGSTAKAAAATTAAPGAPAGQADASTLDDITNDLAGIDAGTSAADKDLSAGDSARAQNDNG